jgi:hypothetical protein
MMNIDRTHFGKKESFCLHTSVDIAKYHILHINSYLQVSGLDKLTALINEDSKAHSVVYYHSANKPVECIG